MKTNQIMFLNIRGCAVVNDNHIICGCHLLLHCTGDSSDVIILQLFMYQSINKKSLLYDKL